MLKPNQIRSIIHQVDAYTMVPSLGLEFSINAAASASSRHGPPAAIVECGVWRGGCSLAMALAQKMVASKDITARQLPVFLFDSFEGLPPAGPRDGKAAHAWQANKGAKEYYDNCFASEESVQLLMAKDFAPHEFKVVKGQFSDTLPRFHSPIALLRIDCDWFDSVMQCLGALMPKVITGSVVIIDDYYAWDGCARAVHEWMVANDTPYRIKSIAGFNGAYFVKELPA